jgi:hypothetical protein
MSQIHRLGVKNARRRQPFRARVRRLRLVTGEV